jgi:hypothetical protein
VYHEEPFEVDDSSLKKLEEDTQSTSELQSLTKKESQSVETLVDKYGLPAQGTGDYVKDIEISYLRRLCESEEGHAQWKK